MARKSTTPAATVDQVADRLTALITEGAEPTRDPAIHLHPDLENARSLLVANGWRVREPAKTRTPAAPREYAPIEDVRAWASEAVREFGTQSAAAHGLGMAVWGPVAAAVKGRPVTLATFTAWKDRLASAPRPEPKVAKPVKTPKPALAKKAPRAKAAGKVKAAPQPE